MQNAWEEARRSQRERMNRLIEQFITPGSEVKETDATLGETAIPGMADTATQPEGQESAQIEAEQPQKSKKSVPIMRNRVKRFGATNRAPGTSVTDSSQSALEGLKVITATVSDDLKEIVQKIAIGRGFRHETLKDGQEGSIYQEVDNKHYIYINNRYLPIYFKDSYRGIITINPYSSDEEIEVDIDVHLDKDTWRSSAATNLKAQYPTLPTQTSLGQEENDHDLNKATSLPSASSVSPDLADYIKNRSAFSPHYYSDMAHGKEAQIYTDNEGKKTYIYVSGFYWSIIMTGNSTALIESNNDNKEFISIRKVNKKWELAPTSESIPLISKSGGGFSIESYINAFFDIEHATKVDLSQLQKAENGLFINKKTDQYYILASGYYWYITPIILRGFEDQETWKILDSGGREHLNIVYNSALGLWVPLQTIAEEDEAKHDPIGYTASADLISEIKKWDADSSVRPLDSGPGLEGVVYEDKMGEHYLYLQKRYWHFSWIKNNAGGITITKNGIQKFIILFRQDNQWHYFDEETIADSFDIDHLLKSIKDAKLDSETREKVESILWGDNFTSLDDFLNELQKTFEDGFYRLYENPANDALIDIILLSNKVSELQKYIAYYEPNKDSETTEHKWNEGLLNLYSEEFSSEVEESSYLYAARQAKIAVDEARKRIAQFSTTSIDQQIKEQHDAISARMKDIVYWLGFLVERPLSVDTPVAQDNIAALQLTIKTHETRINQLKTLRKQILDRKAEYQKVIDDYNKNYRLINISIDFVKEALARKKKLAGVNDNVSIAEELLIDFTLQKIGIRNSVTDNYTQAELDKLKVLSLSQTMIAQLIERHTLSQKLIEEIQHSSINFPPLKNNYQDIEWSNKEAERIYNNIYPSDENPEANQLLSPLLYWLLKNNCNYNSLKSIDIDDVVNLYYSDAYSLNPLKKIKEMPEGYTPLAHMLGSEYFNTDSEYYQQFATYKEKYSDYEASENTKNLLLSSDLSLNEITSKVKKRFYFNVLQSSNVHDKHDGGMLFIELEDGRWVFFSLFPDSLFCRVFSREEMLANIWLNKIANLTAEQIHYHGIESIFLESFFLKNFDPKNKNRKTGKYHTLEARKKKEFEDLIVNTLYKGSDGITYNNPFNDRPYYGLTYDAELNSEQPQETLLETLNKAFRDVLNRSATNRKTVLYQSTTLQTIADIVLPFYAEIRGAIDDPEHKVDTASIILDVVGICFVASQAGTKTAALLKNAKGMGKIIGEGRKIGLAGKGLQKYVIKQMGKQGLINASGLAKISANALIDLVSPVNLEDLSKISFSKNKLTSGLSNIFTQDYQGGIKSRSIPEKYITTDISVDDLYKTHIHGVEVYTPAEDSKMKGKYFIKSEGKLYQIRWDDYSHTWRAVDPANPGRFSYGDPIIFEEGQWVINKNYGGLRGGAIKDPPIIIMGEQPLREGIKEEKVMENLISTPEVNAEAYLEEIKKTGGLSGAILSPSEKCELVLPAMANFLKKKDFENIRFRGMAFYVNGMDKGATNHYLVIGTKNGRDYAFDITAGQFHGQYEELSGPIIMPEEKWAQKYANITSERKLIKYADYPLTQLRKIKIDYGAFSPYLVRGPNCQLPNALVLKRPGWYFPKKTVDDLPATAGKKMAFGNSERANPVRAAARRSRLTSQTPDTSWEYAVTLLENAELLSKGPATTLRTGLRQATKYQRTSASSPGNVDGLFASSNVINSHENLLRVKQGEILIFMEVDPNFPAKGPRPIHVMVSLGNGRFAGVKNNVLDSSLSDGKQILTAEQLGEFVNGTFRRRGNAQLPDLQIIAGEPKNFLRPESPSLKSLAENLHGLPDNVDLAAKSTELLKQAGELATEQAAALQESLGALLNAAKGGSTITATAESLFTTAVQVTDRAALQAMEKGKLVVFANTSSPSFAIHHLMYSLGNGDFMMVNPHLLDKRLVSQNGIINASQFPDELFTKYGVLSGDISLSRLRTASLLGRDASFFVNGPILTVRLHGAPGIANYMDAYELSEVIKGLGLRESPPVKLGQIREIKLESCFGAFGFLPTGKALAHILGKKVTAYPLAFSNALRDSRNLFRRAKVYMPSDLSTLQVEKMVKQQSRNHNFWTKLLQLRQKIVARRVRRSTVLFDNTLEDIAKLSNGNMTVGQFLKDYPEYKSGLSVSEDELKALVSESITDDETFAMRCWDILMLSTYTTNQVDQYLQG